jgi:hypothetical protein
LSSSRNSLRSLIFGLPIVDTWLTWLTKYFYQE